MLALLRLLQLTSPGLPVGAYSYSEGLESLAENGVIRDAESLRQWLVDSLGHGTVRIEAAVLVRAYQAWRMEEPDRLIHWDAWLSASRESEELRSQSWDMGRALLRLLRGLHPEDARLLEMSMEISNFSTAFALAAAHWDLPLEPAVLGYVQSWANNLIGAGVKLIPLGQTAGQRLLWDLQYHLHQAAHEALTLKDDELDTFGWGAALASTAHEIQYSRLFRS